jgi:ribonuclease E
VGNIYKGRIVNIEPSIQAAFVDFGVGRNGFLHVSDVEPAYYRHLERRGDGHSRHRSGRDRHRGGRRRMEEESVAYGSEPERKTDAGRNADRPWRPEADGDPVSRPHSDDEWPDLTLSDLPADPVSVTDLDDRASESFTASDTDRIPGDENEAPRLMDSAERRTEEISNRNDDLGEASDDAMPIDFSARPEAMEEETFDEELSRDWHDIAIPVIEDHSAEPANRETAAAEIDHPSTRGRSRSGNGRRGDRRKRGMRRGPARPTMGRPKPLIQDIFRRGQEVLVQVIKEGIGTKGPTLSTYISIAGRYLVLMPGLNRIGVSRKIADDEQRRRLRDVLHELSPPRGLGFIIRTAGMDKTKKELQRDLNYLSRLWMAVVRRIKRERSPTVIYRESDMIRRTIRDTFTNEIDTIWVDEKDAFENAQEFLETIMPRYANRLHHYQQPEPLFHKYGIEEEIARIQQRHVPLPNGGSIVIDQTEALVAIDVNSGNFRADNNAEETAYQMNLLAAKEIARQLRLRDLGGVIVNDFIDMRDEKHRRGVERALRDAVKRDRARTKILRISTFGLIEMTRQRIRPSLKRSVYQDCPYCIGTGQVKTCESVSIDVMRMMQLAAHHRHVQRIQIRVAEDVAAYLLNKKRKEITRLEDTRDIQVAISGSPGTPPETLEFMCYDNNDNEIKVLHQDEAKRGRR